MRCYLDALNKYAEEMYENADEDRRILTQSRAALENKLNHLMRLAESGNAPETVLERINLLENEIKNLNARLQQIEGQHHIFISDDLIGLKEKFMDYMVTQDTLEARKLIQATIKKIEIDNEKVEIVFNNGIAMNRETAALFRA